MKLASRRCRTVCFLSLLLPAGWSVAAPSDETWSDWNTAVIDQHVIPRYQTLGEAAATMAKSVASYCATPSADGLGEAQAGFVSAMQAWQGIQHVKFGPVLYLMRDSAMQFWPDRKNVGQRQLYAALTSDGAAYDDTFFRDASISIKGYPALERLLFDDEIDAKRVKYPRYCDLMTGIAGNIANMTGSIAAQWDEARSQYTEAGHNDFFEESADASVQMLKSLVEPLEVLLDTKLRRVLGESAADARWKKSESWRSGRSIDNLKTNIDTLAALYEGTTPISVKTLLQGEEQAELAERISQSFATLSQQLSVFPEPADDSLSETQWQALQALAAGIRTLDEQLDEAMIALGINLGFNSRDGD